MRMHAGAPQPCRQRDLMDIVLVVNAGSSSVKFQLYEARDRHDLKRLVKGQIDGVGSRPRLRAEASDRATLVDRSVAAEEVADLPPRFKRSGRGCAKRKRSSPLRLVTASFTGARTTLVRC